MGFQGQLNSVNLADILQTLHANRQTGTLSVPGPEGMTHIHFDGGLVARVSAPTIDGRPFLLHALLQQNRITVRQADEAAERCRSSGQDLRGLLLALGMVPEPDLDEAIIWCIEELVCPTFEWKDGDFTFTDGEPIQELQRPDVVAMGEGRLPTPHLVLEATRRLDEWKRIREVITDPDALYMVDNEGRANLKNLQTDPEMLKVLRYLDGRRTLDAIARTMGGTRFDTYAIASQLVLGGVARPRGAQELVAEAVGMQQAGEHAQARDLLEGALKQARIPEVMRPLAECHAALNQAPQAVELFLELIQQAQDQGDLASALKDLETVIGLSPADPDLHAERAQLLAELGRADDAAAAYVQAAQAYLNTREAQKAVDACHRAKNLMPRAPEPHRYLAKAFLMEGQTDNAVIEYKHLWHALLTVVRPRKALEELEKILGTDCKFPTVKDQVLGHAQNSEAVKTNKAARVLVYLVILLVLAGAGWGAWRVVNQEVIQGRGLELVNKLDATLSDRKTQLQHRAALDEVEQLRMDYSGFPDLVTKLGQMSTGLRDDAERRGDAELERARGLAVALKWDEALQVASRTARDFSDFEAGTKAVAERERILSQRIAEQVASGLGEAQRHWDDQDWSGALDRINLILDRKDLTPENLATVTTLRDRWAADIRSAERLFGRADAILGRGDRKAALAAFRLAASGEGESWADQSRTRAATLELEIARELGNSARSAAGRGDDQATFAAIDEIAVLAREAGSKDVQRYLDGLEMPVLLQLDSPHLRLVVRRGQVEETVNAPPGTTGAWTHIVIWKQTESVTVEGQRTGFVLKKPITIDARLRHTAVPVVMARGPKWRTELTGAATVPPVPAGRQLLVATNRGAIEVVDPILGITRPVIFPDSVGEFRAPPQAEQSRAYAVLDDHLTAIDITTRTRLWSWPGPDMRQIPRLTGLFTVTEHELIQGTLLGFAGAIKGGVQVVAIDSATGRGVSYAPLDTGDLTGIPVIDRPRANTTVLYLPGSGLACYDITACTESSPPRLLYTQQTRGDLIGRALKVTTAGRPALLFSDSSGQVLAVDADPQVGETKRILGAWPLDGTQPSSPVWGGGALAYVSVIEGRTYGLDLSKPGQPAWRYPAAKDARSAVPLIGSPAIGQRGLYLTDNAGTMRCLDLATGVERWRVDLGAPAAGGPAAADGRVFVPLRTGHLLCFEEGQE